MPRRTRRDLGPSTAKRRLRASRRATSVRASDATSARDSLPHAATPLGPVRGPQTLAPWAVGLPHAAAHAVSPRRGRARASVSEAARNAVPSRTRMRAELRHNRRATERKVSGTPARIPRANAIRSPALLAKAASSRGSLLANARASVRAIVSARAAGSSPGRELPPGSASRRPSAGVRSAPLGRTAATRRRTPAWRGRAGV